MQLPLLHRSTQMAVLKKLVRRKVRELRWQRHRAQRRLEMMRQIRWELLRLMQRLIDLRQRDAEQQRRELARRAVGGMLHMYKRWLGKWTRALKSQGRLIRQQEQLKRALNRRLRLLRRRLRKHHRPKQLVDRCFEKLAKAVKRWQRRPDYRQYIEGQELIWAQEVEEVRRYLSDIRGKSVRRRKSPRRTRADTYIDLSNFNSLWKSEVVRKKKRLGRVQAFSEEAPSEREVYRIPKPPSGGKIYPNLDADQMHSSRTRRHRKKDRLVPSLKELQQVFRLLMDQSSSEQGIGTVSVRNSKRKLSRKKAKTDLYQDLKMEVNIGKTRSQRRRDGRNQVGIILSRLLRIGPGIKSKVLQSRMGSIKRPKQNQWPAMTTLRRRIPLRHNYVKKSKSKPVDEKNGKDIEAIEIKQNKGHRRMGSIERKKLREMSDLQPISKLVDEKIGKEIEALEVKKKKGRRQKLSMERKILWDSSDLSTSLSQEYTRKPKTKFVNENSRKEPGINKNQRGRDSMESKNIWDSSDLSISSSHKNVRKRKSKLADEKIRKEVEYSEVKNKKDRRRRLSMEMKNLWDTSDLSTSPSRKYARNPKSKDVGRKIRKEKYTKKIPRVSMEGKNIWDTSDLSTSPSQEYARKPKSKDVDKKLKKDVQKNTKKIPKDSMEGMKIWESSDLATSPVQEYARKPRSKDVSKKIRIDMQKNTKKSPRDSVEGKNLWDSSDLSISSSHKNVRKRKSKFVNKKIRKLSMEMKNLWDISDLSTSPSQEYVRKPKSKDVGRKIRKEKYTKKIPRVSMEGKHLWDLSDLSTSPSQEYVRNPKSKDVGRKIRKEKYTKKIPRVSMEGKNIWDTSDLSTSPSQEYARKSKSKDVATKIRKEKVANKSPRNSKETKNIWESSDQSNPISSTHKSARSKVVDKEVRKETKENEPLNVNNRKSHRRWDFVVSKNLWDNSDPVDPATSQPRHKRVNKKSKKKSLSHQSSDDGTEVMVNKLMKRKQLHERSVSEQNFARDSVTSLTESLKQLVMETRPHRKSFRKSILGLSLHSAGSKAKHRSAQPPRSSNTNLKRTSNRDNMSGIYQPWRSSRNATRAVASAPAGFGRRSGSVNSHRKGSQRRSRGSDESAVKSNDPRGVRGNELKVIRGNEGSDKLGTNADHQLADKKGSETGNKRGSSIGSEKDRAFGKQDKNNADLEVGYPLRVIKGDQTYDQNLNKANSLPIEFKAADTIDHDKNKTAARISFLDDQTIYQDANKTSPSAVELRTDGQYINKTRKDHGEERSRNEKNINRDLLPQLGRPSQSASINEVGLSLRKDEGHRTTSFLVPRNYSFKNLQSDPKYRQIQYFLRDVIEQNAIIEDVPDVEALMKAVGNHYMWGNLKDLYSELLAGGINKTEVKRLLTKKYLDYLKTIRNAQILAPGKGDTSPEGREQNTKRQSTSDQLRNLRFWYRHRISMRTFGKSRNKGEAQSQDTTQDTDGTMYKKLIVQELKAKWAKREKWNERLRRLLPTSETSATMSFASTNTMWEVEPEEEEDLRTIDERYSITNLKKMMKEHEVRFQAMERERMMEKAREGKDDSKVKVVEEQSESLIEPPTAKKHSSQSSKKREKRDLRPINQLYYSPRKTCREQQAIKFYSEYSEDGPEEAVEEDSEYQDSCTENKCPSCGDSVEMPCCAPSPKASSAILSSGSIEACAKNELLVNTMANVCTRCGYVHDQANPCSQPPEDQRKTLLLRMIKAVQAVRSTTQPTLCSEFCSCRQILKRQEQDLSSFKSKLRQVESRVQGCPGADEGGGNR